MAKKEKQIVKVQFMKDGSVQPHTKLYAYEDDYSHKVGDVVEVISTISGTPTKVKAEVKEVGVKKVDKRLGRLKRIEG